MRPSGPDSPAPDDDLELEFVLPPDVRAELEEARYALEVALGAGSREAAAWALDQAAALVVRSRIGLAYSAR